MGDDSFDHRAAQEYLVNAMIQDLSARVNPARVVTFRYRLEAVGRLYENLYGTIYDSAEQRRQSLSQWNALRTISLESRQWSPEQKQAMDAIEDGVGISDANVARRAERRLFISGEPGSGKSEVLIHAAVRAANAGLYVLILCPTGALVHSYKDRLPTTPHITVETIQSGFAIYRNYDKVVDYSPPTRLRRYDLIILDEASQIDDAITTMLFVGIGELPQLPYVVVAADFFQLNPVAGGMAMRRVVANYPIIELTTIFRTKDPILLQFLKMIRTTQPPKSELSDFFKDRMLMSNLSEAVAFGLRLAERTGKVFFWLCVTNPGADKVNQAALRLLGITEEQQKSGFPGDPKVKAGPIYVKEGLFYAFDEES